MADEPERRRFAGSDMEFFLICVVIAAVLGIVAAFDGHLDLALAGLGIALLGGVFAWRSRNKRG